MTDPTKNAFGLSNLGDVLLNEPLADGEVLKYDFANNKWVNGTDATTTSYAGLTDVALDPLSDGQMTYYDNGTSKWKNTSNIIKSGGTVIVKDGSGVYNIQPPSTTTADEFVLANHPQGIFDKTHGGTMRLNNTAGTFGVLLDRDSITSTRTVSFPDAGGEITLDSNFQTLSNKTMTGNTSYNNPANTFYANVPAITANDTFVTENVTQSVTNKTLDATNSVDIGALDVTGEAQGDVLYRDASGWTRLPAGTSGQFLQTAGAGANPSWANQSGENNTASNVGVGGISVFKGKVGVDLEFNSINAGSNKVTVTADGVNNNVDVDVAEANLTIANMSDASSFVTLTGTQDLSNKTLAFGTKLESNGGADLIIQPTTLASDQPLRIPPITAPDYMVLNDAYALLTNKQLDGLTTDYRDADNSHSIAVPNLTANATFITTGNLASINLDDLGDVATGTLSNGDVLVYSIGDSEFKNLTKDGAGIVTKTDVQTVTNKTMDATNSVDIGALSITGEAQGDILYRDASGWTRLPAGTAGQRLVTNGAGANPSWTSNSSMYMPIGEIYYGDGTSTTTINLTTVNNWYIINPTTTLVTNNSKLTENQFDSPSAGRLRYIGTSTDMFHSAISLSMSTANSGDTFEIAIYKNGVIDTATQVPFDFANNNVGHSTAFHKFFTMSTNDYLEVYIRNTTTSSRAVSVANLNLLMVSDTMKM